MNQNRPKNLNLFSIAFPLPAIVSICHRISGALTCVALALFLWIFQQSLTPEGFGHLQWLIKGWCFKLISFALLSALVFHVIAGIRHLLGDLHFGSSLAGGRLGAKMVWVMTAITIIFLGMWIW